jgi:hypothetical protein
MATADEVGGGEDGSGQGDDGFLGALCEATGRGTDSRRSRISRPNAYRRRGGADSTPHGWFSDVSAKLLGRTQGGDANSLDMLENFQKTPCNVATSMNAKELFNGADPIRIAAFPLHVDVAAASHRQRLIRRHAAAAGGRERRGAREHRRGPLVSDHRGANELRDRRPIHPGDQRHRYPTFLTSDEGGPASVRGRRRERRR